jgi:hypothetical protein
VKKLPSETDSWSISMRTKTILKILSIQILLTVSAQARAACVNPPVSASAISQFRANPQDFVAPNSDTQAIEAFVRDLVGSDASLAADFVRVAEGTIPRFQTAIAAGLAQAAIACANTDQQASLLIQQAVAGFQNGQFQASFAAIAGDLSTAATAAANASAVGSAGSVIVTNPNTSPRSTSNPGGGGSLTTPVQLSSSGVFVAITNSTRTNTSTNTAANPVSPTR